MKNLNMPLHDNCRTVEMEMKDVGCWGLVLMVVGA